MKFISAALFLSLLVFALLVNPSFSALSDYMTDDTGEQPKGNSKERHEQKLKKALKAKKKVMKKATQIAYDYNLIPDDRRYWKVFKLEHNKPNEPYRKLQTGPFNQTRLLSATDKVVKRRLAKKTPKAAELDPELRSMLKKTLKEFSDAHDSNSVVMEWKKGMDKKIKMEKFINL